MTLADLTGAEHGYRTKAGAVPALGPLDLHVAEGEFLVVVGPSGSGKSTLLRLLAGFEHPTTGEVRLLGHPPVPGRDVGVVFQQPRLFPWRTVSGNVTAALRWANVPKNDRPAHTARLLASVGLGELGERRTWEISGGQQQRVAIARALAARPRLLLMDEPFAALDALTRERLQEDVRALSDEDGKSVVFVTHSVDEAVFLASRVVVLSDRPGRVALDLPIDLPRSGVSADDLRGSAQFAALRGEVAAAVRATVRATVS
ncbi:ABC transporter ATP-binding protein [Kibdelosporangium phytohabitans]|uniref:ABC transporter n=1 Tax=Kibdelosporangium phytohabitans TaxID=860235 RepID=A0A0N9I3S0_9PSEU|nr:ABC transporter ATP-binding protein [Kibdelosporangium phytohabitans]ALG10704.1 ABC transporter [Kibdelosporangium phytohabitans]MBE1461838.1 taurine transport system ATP-binding protein [Kibdelosporangium phytohabitans]